MIPLQTGAAECSLESCSKIRICFSISILHEFSGEWCNFPVLRTFHCDCEGARGKESTCHKRIGGYILVVEVTDVRRVLVMIHY